MARHVDALPEARDGEEARLGAVAELLDDALARAACPGRAPSVSRRGVTASATRFITERFVKSARVRPPAASMSSTSSSMIAASAPRLVAPREVLRARRAASWRCVVEGAVEVLDLASSSSPGSWASVSGIVALVSTAVTLPQRSSCRRGPTSTREISMSTSRSRSREEEQLAVADVADAREVVAAGGSPGRGRGSCAPRRRRRSSSSVRSASTRRVDEFVRARRARAGSPRRVRSARCASNWIWSDVGEAVGAVDEVEAALGRTRSRAAAARRRRRRADACALSDVPSSEAKMSSDLVGLVEDHELVRGQQHRSRREVRRVEVGVDDERSSSRRRGPSPVRRSSSDPGDTCARPQALLGRDRQTAPGALVDLEGQLVAVAGLGLVRPSAGSAASGRRRPWARSEPSSKLSCAPPPTLWARLRQR